MQAMPSNICFTTRATTIRCSSVTANVLQAPDRTARRLLVVAVLVSLGLHGLLVPPAARWLQAEHTSPDDETPLPTEVILPLADWIITEAAPLGEEDAQDKETP